MYEPVVAVDADWPAVRLGAVLQRVVEVGQPDLPLLSVSAQRGVTLRGEDWGDGLRAASKDLSGYLVVRPGDIVVNKLAARDGAFGRSDHHGLTSPAYFVLRPVSGIDPRFVDYLLHAAPYISEIRRRSKWMPPAQFDISWELLRSMMIRIPGAETQVRVADFLDRETQRQGNIERTIDALTALVQERMASLVHERVIDQPHLPQALKGLASFVNGFPFAPGDHGDSGLPIVRIAQLLDESAPKDYFAGVPDKYCHIDSGDLIFSWSATLTAKIWEGGPAYLNQHLFRVIPRGDVELQWLHHALNAAVPLMKAHMHGSTMTHITRATLSEIRIPVPSAEEQIRIADEIDTALNHAADVLANLESQRALLVERRQALITAAVTGQLDVEAVA